jgi:hypothetical protein
MLPRYFPNKKQQLDDSGRFSTTARLKILRNPV